MIIDAAQTSAHRPDAVEYSLCYVLSNGSVLLKHATRGISKGKWNGLGGKIEKWETPEQNAAREAREESGLSVSWLFYHGVLRAYMNGTEKLTILIHLFSTSHFDGRLSHSEEGVLKWFGADALPLGEMWDDDRHWIPLMLAGKRFDGDFYYNSDNSRVVKYAILHR